MLAIAIVFVLPSIVGMLATFAAFALAARIARLSEAPCVSEPTPNETADWVASFEDLDVDAEWIALADTPVPSPRCFRSQIAEVCDRIKARIETRKAESCAMVREAIGHWYDRADQWESGKPDYFDTLETLEYLANRASDRDEASAASFALHYHGFEEMPLAA